MRELGLFPPVDADGSIHYSPEASGLAALLTAGLSGMDPSTLPSEPFSSDGTSINFSLGDATGKREDLLTTLVQSMLGDLTEQDVKRVLTNVLGCDMYTDPSDGKSYIGPNPNNYEFYEEDDIEDEDNMPTTNHPKGTFNTATAVASSSGGSKKKLTKKYKNGQQGRLDASFAHHVKTMPLDQQSECDRMVSMFRAANVKPQELSSCMCIQRQEVLDKARGHTTCASCLHSVRTLRLKDHPLLEDDGETFRVRAMHLESIETTSRVLAAYSPTSKWMLEKLGSHKKNKHKTNRCRAHASFRKHVEQSDWRHVWDQAPDEFKIGIASMLPSELAQVRGGGVGWMLGWCVVCGVWCVVCGCVVVWLCGCVVCGVWCVVCGVWCVVVGGGSDPFPFPFPFLFPFFLFVRLATVGQNTFDLGGFLPTLQFKCHGRVSFVDGLGRT